MNKLLKVGVTVLVVAGAVGIGAMNASAIEVENTANHQFGMNRGNGRGNGNSNGKQSSLESRASVFGMSAEELQTALETKTMSQIAVEKGMTEEVFRAKMNEIATSRWEARGLSAEEIAQRVADREARHAENSADHEFGSGDGGHQGGYGRNR